MSSKVLPPYPQFHDIDGRPLDAGYIYIGEAGKNPEVYPIPVFWDEALTIPAAQPLRTRNGYISKNGKAGKVYIAENSCSISVKNKKKIALFTDLNSDILFDQKNLVSTVESIVEFENIEPWEGRVIFFEDDTFKYDLTKSGINDGGVIINGWVRQSYKGIANPVWFGADKTGSIEVTPILNAMITAGYKNIHFATAGNYLISTQLISITDGVTINFGKSNGAKIKFGANIIWCQPKQNKNIKFYNIDIQDTLKTSNDGFRPLLINPLGCSEIDVYDVKTEDCAIVLTGAFNGTGNASYSEANADITSPSFNCCKGIRVHHISGKDTLINTRCIVNLSYALGWVTHDVRVPNSKFPAVFWGGDSNPATGNGAASNERKNKKGIMSKIISDNNDALAWGSMGDEILITGCVGENFGDVGIDFEGCTNCVATNNFVKNANNGNYSTFFLNKNVKFVNNVSILSGSKVDHYKNYNITQSNDGLEGVQFTGNTVTSIDVVGIISDSSGTVSDIIIKDNIVKNAIIDIAATNANGASIEDNKLNYTMSLTQSPIRVSTQFTRAIVKDNEFKTSVNQSVAPVTVLHVDFNNSGTYQIESNTVKSGTFSKALKLLNDSANSGIGLILYAFNNKLTSSQIESSNPSRIFIKQWSENKNGESNFPNSADTSQYMWKNMIARPDDYIVGQPQGWVCVSSGSPATWVSLSNL